MVLVVGVVGVEIYRDDYEFFFFFGISFFLFFFCIRLLFLLAPLTCCLCVRLKEN